MNSYEKVDAFIDILESELDKRHMSIPEFAKQMGVPKMTVYRWVKRLSIMSLEKYYRALKVLGMEDKAI